LHWRNFIFSSSITCSLLRVALFAAALTLVLADELYEVREERDKRGVMVLKLEFEMLSQVSVTLMLDSLKMI